MQMFSTLIASALLVTVVMATRPELTPVLNTPNGPVFGAKRSLDGKFYEEYLGIPFAAPPVGNLRWAKPQPVKPWTEPRDATKYSIHCTQFIDPVHLIIGYGGINGEDCLYLNVWVPGGVENNRDLKRPVMIFVHGGAFLLGTGEMYQGYALALHGDMILVSINYRVGALGFLSTGDSELPGNYGLWDQNAAFKWVQQSIATFGGDPSRVTIFGQSAGGASVGHAVVSPHSVGLFKSAISISGGSTTYFGTTERPLETAMIVGELFGCNAHNSKELVACLRKQDAHALDLYTSVLSAVGTIKLMNAVPVVDGDYLPAHPKQLFEQGAGKDINFITGSCYDDAGGFVILNPVGSPVLGSLVNFATTSVTQRTFIRLLLGPVDNFDEAFSAIVKLYPDLNNLGLEKRTQALTRGTTEFIFGSVSNWEANQHSKSRGSGGTYLYQFKYPQSFLSGYPKWFNGSHMDDLYSVFGEPFLEVYRAMSLMHDFSDTDKYVSNAVMNYYSNIAHTGNPNEGPFRGPVEWKEHNPDQQDFLLQSSLFQMDSFLTDSVTERYKFWTDDFPRILKFPPKPQFSSRNSGLLGGAVKLVQNTLSETELQAGLESIKIYLRALSPTAEVWNAVEKQIDGIVADRKLKLGILGF